MKLFAALFVLFLASPVLASDFVSEMEKTFQRFSLCANDDVEKVSADLEFRAMVDEIKTSEELGKKSKIEIMDFNANYVRLFDKSHRFSCEIHIDGYDERCYVAFCD